MTVSNATELLDILIVDDSPTYRMILARAVKGWPSGNLVGTAGDGEAAIAAIAERKPHLVLLDVSMPILDGIETLKRIHARWTDVDVVMCSGVDASQTGLTMQALSLGALDFIAKPQGENPTESFASLTASLHPLLDLALSRKRSRILREAVAKPGPLAPFEPPPSLRAAFRSRLEPLGREPGPPVSAPAPENRSRGGLPSIPPVRQPSRSAIVRTSSAGLQRHPPARIEYLLVGVSTGGPNALQTLVPRLPADLPFPILCVQHMPPMFTASLAERLDRASPLKVVEGAEGVRPENGAMYIAPGGRHMVLSRGADGRPCLRLTDTAPVNSCRPSVDVLFRSVAETAGGDVVTLVLTGMGADGADGVTALRAKGAWSIVQDEASSVVWGMPGAVAQAGQADEILPLERIADRVVEIARRGRAR